MPVCRRTDELRPSAPITSGALTSPPSAAVYVTLTGEPALSLTSRTPRMTSAPALAAASIRAWHASGWRMLSEPGIPSAIRHIGISPASPTPSTYCFQTGATCAPASSSSFSIPSWRASFTPQTCMLSPRTRSSKVRLASRTVTPRPCEAKAYAREAPAIPPPTMTTSDTPAIFPPSGSRELCPRCRSRLPYRDFSPTGVSQPVWFKSTSLRPAISVALKARPAHEGRSRLEHVEEPRRAYDIGAVTLCSAAKSPIRGHDEDGVAFPFEPRVQHNVGGRRS